MTFIEPQVTEAINRLTYLWKPFDLKIVADRITDAGTTELWFYHVNGSGDHLLHTAKVNVMSSSTMTSLGKRLKEHSKDVPWLQVLTYVTAKTMEYSRRGEPGVVIEPSTSGITHPGYYVDPIIMKGVPNIIFGDKGVAKTTLSLALLGIASLGIEDSPLGFSCPKPGKIAMLDWESTKALTDFTMGRLIEGKTIDWFPLPYLRCKQSMADDIDRIGNFLHDHSVELVLIDSLGQAAGSDKFDSSGKSVALRFFECLRLLNITSLIIAQNAKSEENKKTIFGSTYYTYYSRNIFELRGKQDDRDDNVSHIALFHHESNYSKKRDPIGFQLKYTDESIMIEHEEVSMARFIERVNQTIILCDFLKTGAKSRQEIIKVLNIPEGQVDMVMSRAKKKGLITPLGSGMWGLKSNEREET